MNREEVLPGTKTARSPSRLGSSPAPLIAIEDLSVKFHSKRGAVDAVGGLTLSIGAGETVGLVGETGSGKTVTARSLLRLVPTPPGEYAGGRILFRPRAVCRACDGEGCAACGGFGRVSITCSHCGAAGCDRCRGTGLETLDLLTLPEARLRDMRGNRIAMIFQDPGKALNPALSVRQQLSEVFSEHRPAELLKESGLEKGSSRFLRRAAHGRSTFLERRVLDIPPFRSKDAALQRRIDDRVAEALAATRIPNPRKVMNSYPHELSGGMKQRVMIAQALACDPDLLIADEPTTALDVTIQARILDLIAELQQERHAAVLYISHDLSLVKRISARVAVMYAGKLVEVAPTEELFAEPMHPYTRALLAAIPSEGQRRGELAAIEGTVPELIDPPPMCRFHTRCPYAADACRTIEPPLKEWGPSGHRTACFLYDSADQVGASPEDMPSRDVGA